jgi:hypothetical protein
MNDNRDLAVQAATKPENSQLQKAAELMVTGNLAGMTMVQKAEFLGKLAEAEGIPAFPPPYVIIQDSQGKQKIVSTKSRAEALRNRDRISVKTSYFGPMRQGSEFNKDFWEAQVEASAPDGRVDTNVGIVFLGNLSGEARSNKMMAALTKAQNRVTYSICGASMPDETEADSMGWKREELPLGPRTVVPKALTSPQAEPILVEAEMLAPKPLKGRQFRNLKKHCLRLGLLLSKDNYGKDY